MGYPAVFVTLGNNISRSYPYIPVAQIFESYGVGLSHPVLDIMKVGKVDSRLLGNALGEILHYLKEQLLHIVVAA